MEPTQMIANFSDETFLSLLQLFHKSDHHLSQSIIRSIHICIYLIKFSNNVIKSNTDTILTFFKSSALQFNKYLRLILFVLSMHRTFLRPSPPKNSSRSLAILRSLNPQPQFSFLDVILQNLINFLPN